MNRRSFVTRLIALPAAMYAGLRTKVLAQPTLPNYRVCHPYEFDATPLKIAIIDLAGIARETVLSVGHLDYQGFHLREVMRGRWTGIEVSGQIGKMFTRHPDTFRLFAVEPVGMETLFWDVVGKQWWPKVDFVRRSASPEFARKVESGDLSSLRVRDFCPPGSHGTTVQVNRLRPL